MNGRVRARRHQLHLRRRHGAPRAVCGPLVGCPESGVTLFFPRFLARGWGAPEPRTLPVLATKEAIGWPVQYQARAGAWTFRIPEPHQWWPAPDPHRLVHVVQCAMCPSHWSAWTAQEVPLYLRYRGGIGSVEMEDGRYLCKWDEHDPDAHEISLRDFLSMTSLTLDPGAVLR